MNDSKINTDPLRGMRDFLPKDWMFRGKLLKSWETAAERRGFLRYETPVVESLSLLERKAGEEISDQIYAFQDKSGRDIALRPEITPSMVRIFSGNREAFSPQGKIYSIGQCFRYERAAAGRKREHFQWNIDIVGESSTAAEAYLLGTAVDALSMLGFTANDFRVRFSSREMMSDFMSGIQVPTEKAGAVLAVVDKKDKISSGEFKDLLLTEGLGQGQVDALQNFCNCTQMDDVKCLLKKDSPALGQLDEFMNFADAFGVADYLQVDPSIVRGLSYYTGIVFEAFDTQRKYRAIFGGGRYDNLFGNMTSKGMPAVGLGFGDVVVAGLYDDKFGAASRFQGVDFLLGASSAQDIRRISTLFSRIVAQGQSAEVDMKPAKDLGRFLSRASDRNAQVSGFVGRIEEQNGTILFKNMDTSEQIVLPFDQNVAANAVEWRKRSSGLSCG